MRKFTSAVSTAVLAVVANLVLSPNAKAATYYWDSDGSNPGFGTAGGTWADPTLGSSTQQGWSTDATGATTLTDVSTVVADSVNFGTASPALAAGTINVSGTVAVGTITNNTSGLILQGGTIQFTGITNASNKALTINSNLDMGTAGRTITGSGSSSVINIGGNITGGPATGNGLVLNTPFTVTLSGTNNFTGNVQISQGALSVSSIGNQGSTTSNLGQGTTIAGQTTGSGGATLKYTGGGETTDRLLTNANTGTGGFSIDSSGTGLLKLNGTFTNSGGAHTLTLTGTGTGEYAGAITDSTATSTMNLSKAGAGTWTISNNNTTFKGTTTLAAGTLSLGNSGAIGSGTGNILFTGGALQFTSANTTDYSGRIVTGASSGAVSIDTNGQNVTFASNFTASQAGGLTKTGAGTLTLTGANAYAGATTISGGALQLRSNAGNTTGGVATVMGTGAVSIGTGATLQLRADSNTTFATGTGFAIGGTGSTATIDVDQLSTGSNVTLALGASAVQNSTLNVTSTNGYTLAMGAVGESLAANGTAHTTTFNPTTASLTLTSLSSTLGTGGTSTMKWVLDGSAANNAVTGVINNGQSNSRVTSLTKSGSSTWNLSGVNTYAGGTIVNGGTLATLATGKLGTGNVTVNAATLTLGNNADLADAATLTVLTGANPGTGSSLVNLNFTGADTLFAITNGTLSLSPGTYAAGDLNTFFGTSNFAGTGSLTIVPEPSTLAVLSLGGLVLLRRRKGI